MTISMAAARWVARMMRYGWRRGRGVCARVTWLALCGRFVKEGSMEVGGCLRLAASSRSKRSRPTGADGKQKVEAEEKGNDDKSHVASKG